MEFFPYVLFKDYFVHVAPRREGNVSKALKNSLYRVIKAMSDKTKDDRPRLRKALALEEQLLEVRKGLAKHQCEKRVEKLKTQITEASGTTSSQDKEYLKDLIEFYNKHKGREEWNVVRKKRQGKVPFSRTLKGLNSTERSVPFPLFYKARPK